MKKLISTTLLISSLSFSAFAGGGSADTGGGNAVGNQLLDLFENTGTTTVELTQIKAYQQVVKPIFENAESKVPGVTKVLLSAVEGKIWLLDTKKLSRKSCLNSSMIEAAKDVVGCQNNLEVRLYKPWFDKVDSKQQAALIIHEIVRGLALKHREHLEMTDEGVAFLTRTFMTIDQHTEAQLVDIFKRTNVANDLAGYSDYVSLNNKVVIPTYRKACMGSQRANIYDSISTFAHVTMNGTYSDGERDVAFDLMKDLQTWNTNENEVIRRSCKIMSDFISTYQQ